MTCHAFQTFPCPSFESPLIIQHAKWHISCESVFLIRSSRNQSALKHWFWVTKTYHRYPEFSSPIQFQLFEHLPWICHRVKKDWKVHVQPTNRCHLALPAVVNNRLFQTSFVSFGKPSLNTTWLSSVKSPSAYCSRRACSAASCPFLVSRVAFGGGPEDGGYTSSQCSLLAGVPASFSKLEPESDSSSRRPALEVPGWPVLGPLICLFDVGARRMGFRDPPASSLNMIVYWINQPDQFLPLTTLRLSRHQCSRVPHPRKVGRQYLVQ